MNRSVTTLSLVVIAVVILGGFRSSAAQTVRTDYRGVSTLLEDFGFGRSWITGDLVWHVRDWRQIAFDDADDPRVRGNVLVTINLNFHFAPPPALFYGPMWGTVRIENEGGSWTGTWVGERTMEGHSFFQVVMKGEGGYRGLRARADYARTVPFPGEPFEFVGFIVETPGS